MCAGYGILKIITLLAVVSNVRASVMFNDIKISIKLFQAFVIAYTSDFIPRMVYKYVYSESHDLKGYIYHSLSSFNTSDYKEEWGAKNENDPETCQYRGYRMPYNSTEPYDLSPVYWHVFAARLAFVVIFEHLVFIITAFMQFLIPDVSESLALMFVIILEFNLNFRYRENLRLRCNVSSCWQTKPSIKMEL